GRLDDAPAGGIAIIGMAENERREGGVVGRRRLVHPGDRLHRIAVEARHHIAEERAAVAAPVMSANRELDGPEAEVATAPLVRDREAVAADPSLAAADEGEADAAGAKDDDAAVLTVMGAEAGDMAVAR